MACGLQRPEPPPQDRLCNVCKDVDFRRYRYATMNKVRLGKWRDLVGSQSCPFCRLVVRALRSNWSHTMHNPDDAVTLSNGLSWELGIEISPYNQLQSEAYSNLFDLRSVAKRCRKLPYRFVAFTKQSPEDRAFIQYLADPIQDRGQTKFLGRSVDRERVPISLIRSWIRRCEEYHDDICEEAGVAGRRLPHNLRLIDVVDRTLIRASAGDVLEYLTLSYVWGVELMKQEYGASPAETLRADLQISESGDECTPITKPLPRTIDDAMWLTRELGYRYLWVDALCIVQDDPLEEMQIHLERMDAVYNCSKLTIVAASGLHANTGLPGVSVPRKHSPAAERVDSFEMAAMCPSFSELENSRYLVWNTRGWTFQEKVLAKRILLFTEFQVYYRCSESIWTEEAFMETQQPSKSVEARVAKYRWAADRQPHIPSTKLMMVKMVIPQLNISDEWNYLGKFPDYAAAIREYSQRELSNPADVLVAVEGLLRTLRMDTGRFIYGLPEAHLLQSLLWHSEPGCTQTRINHQLPTWTWASWTHERGVVFDVLDIRLLRVLVLVIRNVLRGVGKAFSKLGGSSDSSSSSDTSSDSYTSSSSSSSLSDTPSSSSSGVPFGPPPVPLGGRDWTTFNAMGKASANLALCFSLPLMFQHHTIKHVFLYDQGKAQELESEEPLSYKTFSKNQQKPDSDDSDDSRGTPVPGTKRRASNKVYKRHQKQATFIQGPVLAFKTRIVRFRTGACLSTPPPRDDNECGVFELLDSEGDCIGEVWATLVDARRGRQHPLEFLTVSWGLSLQHATIANHWVPRWTYDAKILSKSRMKMLFKACQIVEEVMSWNAGKHLAGNYGVRKSKSAVQDQPSVMSFFDALLTAKKGDPLPKFLWSTVNLLLVDYKQSARCYKRVGTGRVIFESWLINWSSPEEVILA